MPEHTIATRIRRHVQVQLPSSTRIRMRIRVLTADLMSRSTQWKAMTVMTVDGFGFALAKSAQTFLIEQALCRSFYAISDPAVIRPDGSVPEDMCKTDDLQSQVAFLSSTLNFTLLIASFLATPVFARLALTVGKRTVLLINAASYMLRMILFTAVVYFYTFTDVRWVLLLWVLELVGGGMPVREVLLWMYMAESVPEDGLTGAFNVLSAILIGMMSVGTFIGALLLRQHVWLLCSIVICICALVMLLICLLPNHHKSLYPEEENISDAEDSPRSSASQASSPATSLLNGEQDGRGASQGPPPLWQTVLRAATVDLLLSIQFVVQALRNPLTLRVMSIFFTYTLAGTVSGTSQQWASSTFHTSLADVDKVTSMEQVVSAIVLFSLPTVSQRLLRPRLRSKQNTDLWVITASLVFCAFGALVMSLAPSIGIYAVGVAVSALGVGLADSLRSFATSALSDTETLESLYMSIRTMQSLAAIVGTPLWGGIFLLILKSDGGLPPGLLFFATGIVFLVSLYSTMPLRGYR
ncbi:Major facilitator superfamily domain, general substrate transporter [Metarhizium robertsii ARSEF 23]|uniref:Major facilitator superfamily domain, general substrate transporter n=1 Tax=Metarhizium robertsii (strain ARSEF 23 / ATCC MYA-3075) TaxID=655844 RepID=E9FBP4_METRA|nr:Major facilitator superfamily domain, general substrate transporter [Metarhizium robertsii ARSEF 23]EFY94863.1 Major facilitator superfamily domain, general substrate transporter [Metarhizium robertsii ARSEF 23]